jgi:murein L,D-transpeptidase YcbB/YkuD
LKKLGVIVRHDWLEGGWVSNIVIEKTTPTTTIYQARNTNATLDDVLGGKVKLGMGNVTEGASIKELRLLLKGSNELDLYNYMGRSPERFDADLEKAVKSFQSRVGLTPSGVVDKETLNKLIDDFVSKVDGNAKNASWITQFHKAHADLRGSREMKDIDQYVANMRRLSAAN